MIENVNLQQRLKKDNTLMEYIRDSLGTKIGIIISTKGPNRNTPQIGWVLFRNIIGVKERTYKTLKSLNNIYARLGFASIISINYDTYKFINSIKINYTTYIIPNKTIIYDTAVKNLSTDRSNWFVGKEEGDNLLNNNIKVNLNNGETTYIKDEIYANHIRKSIRAMEYRAWKYFK